MRRRALVAVAAAVALEATGRPLPQFDALSSVAAGPVPKAIAAHPAVARAHVEPRTGRPTFVWLRPGTAAEVKSVGPPAPEEVARATLATLGELYGIDAGEAAEAALHSAERLRGGGHLLRFKIRHAGHEVFREFPAVVLDSRLEPVAVSGDLGPTRRSPVASASPGDPFVLTAAQAVARALGDYGFDHAVAAEIEALPASEASADSAAAGYQRLQLSPDRVGSGGARMGEPARAKRVWFRMPAGLVPAWYLELDMVEPQEPGAQDLYSYVIAADDGRLLFRNNLSSDATFTYRAYAETTTPFLPLPGPHGRVAHPHPTGTNDGFNPPPGPANMVTLQNGPISTGDPWLPDGATTTTGNNVRAWANRYTTGATNDFNFDADAQECVPAVPVTQDVRACVTGPGVFDHAYDHGVEAMANKAQDSAAVTNLFYVVNWLHDWFYDSGFKEVDGNAQSDNYGRGGLGNDRINAQVDKIGGTNNANMSTPSDGGAPRMRMYRFVGGVASASLTTSPGGTYQANVSTYGPIVYSLAREIVAVTDTGGTSALDGCDTYVTNVTGRIALVNRGNCTFLVKAQRAQAAGAHGLIVQDNQPGTPPLLNATDASLTIPGLSITQADGNALRVLLSSGTVNATMDRTKKLDRESAFDNGIVAHEWGHYISHRLVGDANGISTNQSRGLGEGWGDFIALLMLLKPGDNLQATYTAGAGHSQGARNVTAAHYAGFRRYPYSRDLAKNPLTFRHIADENALPASPAPIFVPDFNSEVHATGEIWASMLWQCYTALVGDTARLTFAEAQSRMKAYLVAGLKLTPVKPTLLEARDALLAAMAASSPQDLALCAAAFAQRGAGAGAVAPDRFSTTNNGVVESFSAGGELRIESIAYEPRGSDYCDGDASLDAGETATVVVTIRNIGTLPVSGAALALSSANPSLQFEPAVAVPVIAPLTALATMRMRVTMAGTTGPTLSTVTATLTQPSLPAQQATASFHTFVDPAPATTAIEKFESASTPWTTSLQGTTDASLNWIRPPMSAMGRYFRGPTGEVQGLAWLTSPALTVAAPGIVTMTLTHRYHFEADTVNWDGGVIEVSFDNGATWVDLNTLVPAGYGGTLTSPGSNPLAGRNAFVGFSASYPSFATVAFAIPAPAGTMRVRFGVGNDSATSTTGWDIDTVQFAGIANMPFEGTVSDTRQCVPGRLSNISTRMQVLSGDDVMIGGFVVGGSTTKRLAIVATGPSLTAYGITNPLANPTLRLVRSSDQATIATNDNWQAAANQANLTAAGFAPSHSLEAAILADLAPGAYTAIVEGAGGGTGVSVIGVYEVDHPETPLINIATRGRVLTGIDVMIGGFVINGTGPQTVAIVATGPSLGAYGIASPLANPTLRLVRSSDQATIATNDDWQSASNASQLSNAGFAPSSPLEAAILVTLPPGAYTAIVEGVGGGTGVAVIGVYKVN